MSKESDQYRFSGYNLPMIQLDATGANYIYIPQELRNPFYVRQPPYWSKPAYRVDPPMSGAQRRSAQSGKLYKPL
jgi:hypothetical protein